MDNRWSEEEATNLSELSLLAYQSRLIGADPSLVICGGGNTSLKTIQPDFRGRNTKVLFVKGSGRDMKYAQTTDFSTLRLDDILPLFERSNVSDEEVAAYLERCLMEPGSPRPSIETLLHSFMPHTSIIHSHADSILSLTNNRNSQEILTQVFGNDVALVPYRLPGFLLSREVATTVLKRPGVRGAILLNHGLVTWGSTVKGNYDTHIELVNQAEEHILKRSIGKVVFGGLSMPQLERDKRHAVAAGVTPALRAMLRPKEKDRILLRFDDSENVLDFIGSALASSLVEHGAATPDHLMHTKRIPLLVKVSDPSYAGDVRRAIEHGIERYRKEYTDWYNQRTNGLLEMRDPNPSLILVPGIGMWTAGRDIERITATSDMYHHTISIMAGAQAVNEYASLSIDDAYDAEYWPLEMYKLTLLPTEKELSRRVAIVTGGASGIGKAIAKRLADEGAHVAIADIDITKAAEVAAEINSKLGGGYSIAVPLDVTNPEHVAQAFRQTVLAFGGVDILVSNAGIAPTGPLSQIDLAEWQNSLDVNATGHLLVSQEAIRIMQDQGLGGSLVFIATKNVTAPGRGFGAYSAAKASEVQLARVLAIENGIYGIRCNIINPDAVFQDSGLWSEELRKERANAHGITVSELEDYYRKRNLLQAFITPNDVAETTLFLASDRSAKTTGCMLTVDGGLPEAFPR